MDISTITGIYVEGNSTEESFDECTALEKLHKIGFRAVDLGLSGVDRENYILSGDDWEKKIERVGETAARLGMNLFQCHMPFAPTHMPSFRRPEFSELFDESMRRAYIAAGRLGIKWGVVHPRAYPEHNYENKASLEENRAYYDKYVEIGLKNGVGTAFENMNPPPAAQNMRLRYCQHYDQLIELADSYHDPLVGICWDTGHANQNRLDQGRALRAIGSWLRVLHVNDNHYGTRDEHLCPFMGEIDWNATIDALAEIGYNGTMNLEVGKVAKTLPRGELRDAGVRLVYESGKYLRDMLLKARRKYGV